MMSIYKTMQKGDFRLLILVLVFSMSLVSNAQRQQEIEPVSEFATQALAEYVQNVVTTRNVVGLGFENLAEAKSASIGRPYKVTFVGLRDLKAYETEEPATAIIRDSGSFWFPVLVNGQTRAKLEILRSDGEFVAGEFGARKTASAIADVTEDLPEVISRHNIHKPFTVTLMKIPVLNATFVHIAGTDGDYLVPAMLDPQKFELERGKAYRADAVFARLKEFVAKIDENKLM